MADPGEIVWGGGGGGGGGGEGYMQKGSRYDAGIVCIVMLASTRGISLGSLVSGGRGRRATTPWIHLWVQSLMSYP